MSLPSMRVETVQRCSKVLRFCSIPGEEAHYLQGALLFPPLRKGSGPGATQFQVLAQSGSWKTNFLKQIVSSLQLPEAKLHFNCNLNPGSDRSPLGTSHCRPVNVREEPGFLPVGSKYLAMVTPTVLGMLVLEGFLVLTCSCSRSDNLSLKGVGLCTKTLPRRAPAFVPRPCPAAAFLFCVQS